MLRGLSHSWISYCDVDETMAVGLKLRRLRRRQIFASQLGAVENTNSSPSGCDDAVEEGESIRVGRGQASGRGVEPGVPPSTPAACTSAPAHFALISGSVSPNATASALARPPRKRAPGVEPGLRAAKGVQTPEVAADPITDDYDDETEAALANRLLRRKVTKFTVEPGKKEVCRNNRKYLFFKYHRCCGWDGPQEHCAVGGAGGRADWVAEWCCPADALWMDTVQAPLHWFSVNRCRCEDAFARGCRSLFADALRFVEALLLVALVPCALVLFLALVLAIRWRVQEPNQAAAAG